MLVVTCGQTVSEPTPHYTLDFESNILLAMRAWWLGIPLHEWIKLTRIHSTAQSSGSFGHTTQNTEKYSHGYV